MTSYQEAEASFSAFCLGVNLVDEHISPIELTDTQFFRVTKVVQILNWEYDHARYAIPVNQICDQSGIGREAWGIVNALSRMRAIGRSNTSRGVVLITSPITPAWLSHHFYIVYDQRNDL